jgi:hypothetical protein
LSRLEETGYDGAVILEVNTQADLEESLKRVTDSPAITHLPTDAGAKAEKWRKLSA